MQSTGSKIQSIGSQPNQQEINWNQQKDNHVDGFTLRRVKKGKGSGEALFLDSFLGPVWMALPLPVRNHRKRSRIM